ncbi:uncharacterized protein RJT20DRAFT_94537 [Scheffersomyces xylosifermentans]|uniref:uncharacterized protein n=1 Tax=Scheffersomyces xylosifermentans TaxID=1304137 RepID=UPI00315D03FE
MASIEQDDMFNMQNDDEDMMDENEDDGEDLNNGSNGYGEDEDNDEDNEDEENDDDNDDEDDDDDEEEEEEDEEMNAEDEEEEDDDEDDDDEDAKFMDAREHNEDIQPSAVVPALESTSLSQEDGDVIMVDDKEEQEDDEKRQIEGDIEDGSLEEEEEKDIEKDTEDHAQQEEAEVSEADEGPQSFRERIISKAKVATEFDIVPSVAIPYTSQCQSLAFTDGPKWILTGGEDGFIRKYDFIASIQGKSPLTMAQKHNLVDSLTKAGVICSYWENEQPLTKKELMKTNSKLKISDFSTGSVNYEPKVNPVYSLDVERNGYWCLSGLLSGGISLYTMRYNEGNIHHYFRHGSRKDNSKGHSDAVSVIRLNTDQNKFLSGSWDKSIREWDLNTGQSTNLFLGSSGQISNVQYRPLGLADLSLDIVDESEAADEAQNDKTNNGKAEEEDDINSLFGESDEESGKETERKVLETKDKSSPKPAFNTGSKASNKTYKNESIFMSSSMNGTINIWDVRVASPVLRLGVSEGTPPWCMSSTWSNCGDLIYAGRRNSTVEEFSIRMPHKRAKSGHNKDTMVPNVSKLLQFPKISGPVSAISTMPNNNFLLCGSNDNIRLYDLTLYDELSNASINKNKQATPFLIIPGHHGGILSALHVDETGRFMVSASGNRGWGHSAYTDTVLIYEIDFEGI